VAVFLEPAGHRLETGLSLDLRFFRGPGAAWPLVAGTLVDQCQGLGALAPGAPSAGLDADHDAAQVAAAGVASTTAPFR
jgi:hypothetical protein